MEKKKTTKVILKAILCVILALVLIAIGYLGYVLLSCSRIDDNQQITP